MRRKMLLVLSALMLLAWVVLWFVSVGAQGIHGAFLRVGLVCGSAAIAIPSLEKIPPVVFRLLGVSAVIIAARPKLAFVVLPVLGLLQILNTAGVFMERRREAKKRRPPRSLAFRLGEVTKRVID